MFCCHLNHNSVFVWQFLSAQLVFNCLHTLAALPCTISVQLCYHLLSPYSCATMYCLRTLVLPCCISIHLCYPVLPPYTCATLFSIHLCYHVLSPYNCATTYYLYTRVLPCSISYNCAAMFYLHTLVLPCSISTHLYYPVLSPYTCAAVFDVFEHSFQRLCLTVILYVNLFYLMAWNGLMHIRMCLCAYTWALFYVTYVLSVCECISVCMMHTRAHLFQLWVSVLCVDVAFCGVCMWSYTFLTIKLLMHSSTA